MIWYAPSCKCHEAHLPMPFMQIPSNASHLLQRRQSLGHAFSLKPGGERAHGQVSEQRMVLLMAMQVGCILETAQQYEHKPRTHRPGKYGSLFAGESCESPRPPHLQAM